jgi:hypothetical protein
MDVSRSMRVSLPQMLMFCCSSPSRTLRLPDSRQPPRRPLRLRPRPRRRFVADVAGVGALLVEGVAQELRQQQVQRRRRQCRSPSSHTLSLEILDLPWPVDAAQETLESYAGLRLYSALLRAQRTSSSTQASSHG